MTNPVDPPIFTTLALSERETLLLRVSVRLAWQRCVNQRNIAAQGIAYNTKGDKYTEDECFAIDKDAEDLMKLLERLHK